MSDGHWKDNVERFLGFTSKVFRPYLRQKYFPKRNPSWEDRMAQLLVFIGTWAVVALLYVIFIYYFVYPSSQGRTFEMSDLLALISEPKKVLKTVWEFAKGSIYFNAAFLVVGRFAVIGYAESTFLKEHFVHLRLSGLIKTIALSKFNWSSQVKEQDERQTNIARKNVLSLVDSTDVNTLSILAASGWDLFGSGHPLTNQPVVPSPSAKGKWWKGVKKAETPIENGFLLPVISEPFRRVRILLIDPNAQACAHRAEGYLRGGKHKVIQKPEQYKETINKVIENLKEAYKKNQNLELKVISFVPQWKVILTEKEAWVQPITDGIRSDHVPLYGFRKSEFSMYHAFWNSHESLWHSTHSTAVDLSQ